MTIWHDSEPARRIEREARYAHAGPAIATASLWCDLGCGDGAATALTRPEGFGGELLLVNSDAVALERAGRELETARCLQADLADAADVAKVAGELQADGIVVTCFDVIQHLKTFAPLVRMLTGLEGATVFLNVPNDALWPGADDGRPTTWGEGTLAELRTLLPGGHAVAAQRDLVGSDIGSLEDGPAPAHFVVSWGPAPGEFVRAASEAEPAAQRDWLLRLQADRAYYRAAYEQAMRERDQLRERLARLEQGPRVLPASVDADAR